MDIWENSSVHLLVVLARQADLPSLLRLLVLGSGLLFPHRIDFSKEIGTGAAGSRSHFTILRSAARFFRVVRRTMRRRVPWKQVK